MSKSAQSEARKDAARTKAAEQTDTNSTSDRKTYAQAVATPPPTRALKKRFSTLQSEEEARNNDDQVESIYSTSNPGTQNSEDTRIPTDRLKDQSSQDGNQSDNQEVEDGEAFGVVEDSTIRKMPNLRPEDDITRSTREFAYEKLKLLPADADLPVWMERTLLRSQQVTTAQDLMQVPSTHASRAIAHIHPYSQTLRM